MPYDEHKAVGNAKARLTGIFSRKKKKKKKTRQEQIEDQLRKAGLTEDEINRMKGKKKK